MGEHEVAHRAVFLDRDGVLNPPVVRDGLPYPPSSAEEFELYSDAPEGCSRLKAAGFVLIVVTNQPDVGRGTVTIETVEAVHAKLRDLLPAIDAVEVCYHGGSEHGEPCDCRKPKPGMLLRAAAAHRINFARSFLVGDRWRDVDCARAAGCSPIFIDRGYREQLRQKPDIVVRNFAQAVDAILQHDLT